MIKTSYNSLRQREIHPDVPIRIYKNSQDDEYPSHWHQSYEIIMPVSGRYQAAVDQVDYEVSPGEVFLIPPGVVHSLYPLDEGLRYIIIIDQEVVMQIHGLPAFWHCFYPCVHITAAKDSALLDVIKRLIQEAVNESDRGEALSQQAIRAYLTIAMIRLGRWLSEDIQTKPDDIRQHMSSVMLEIYSYIADHCHEKMTLDDIAAHTGYSKYHFARVFKQYTGMSFYSYYMKQRIQLCRHLLTEMNIPVTEVALRSGFGSIATFNRIFRQYQGMTPTEYRRLYRSGALAAQEDHFE